MQLDRIHIALIAALIYDTQVHYRNKARSKQIQNDSLILWEQLKTSRKQVDYLMEKLNEHEIPMSEFDKIVFNNLD